MDPLSLAIGAGVNLLGGFLGRQSQEDQRAKNEALQREFAQNSVQWRVADAKKAGISPLYALGAPTMSPSVGVQGDPLGAALSSMGQDISRSKFQSLSEDERQMAGVLGQLGLERAQLQNDLLRAQIAKLSAGQVAPSMIPGADALLAGGSGPAPGGAVPFGDVSTVRDAIGMDKKGPTGHKGIIIGGDLWPVPPNTSTGQDIEDELGDESPGAKFMQTAAFLKWVEAKYGPQNTWPKSLREWVWRGIKDELRTEWGNAKRWFRSPYPWK